MCGIAGIFNLDGSLVSINVLQQMNTIQRHRGPDDEGYWAVGFIGFGHRRLAVLDLTPAGHQPMLTEDSSLAITYCGEVYNFPELKRELEAKGHKFYSRTDTEVVLKSYLEWDIACLNRFNGMFAFAIWDKRKNELFLARDRYGIKPLYYYYKNKKLIFASEIKAILLHPDVCSGLCLPALFEYFTFQNIFTDKTLFNDIYLLPAGTYAKVQLGDYDSFKRVRYWDYNFQEPVNPNSEEEYLEGLNHLFQQAVSRQLISDVPLGSYLSGGMDSASITSIAAGKIPYLSTFTVGFDLHSASGFELGFDEREKAEYLSYLYKTEHYEVVLKAGDMERVMESLIWHLEDLRVGQCYPNYYIARLASKFVKVVLAGNGGDELFGGYPWRYYRAAVNQSHEEYIDKYYKYWQRLIPNRFMPELFRPDIWDQIKYLMTIDIFKDVLGSLKDVTTPEEYINRSLYFEIKTFLHGLFIVEDKLSMANGLETRIPFMDNDLVDFAMKLPVGLKLRNLGEVTRIDENYPGPKARLYFDKTNDGKIILRKMMARYVPDSIASQNKQGFSAPDASWFKGESVTYIKNLILDKNAKIYNYFQPAFVERILNEHTLGIHNHRLFIWSLLCFEWWMRIFKMGV